MQAKQSTSPPLAGIRVIEFAGLGPTPYAGMLLADLGADVLRIDRPGGPAFSPGEKMPVDRGRRSLCLDLKKADAVDLTLRIIEKADVLIEGFRPGVMERLGLGPDAALARNPRLIYGRMTGWGQDGPLARTAGHDLNFLALTGVLEAIGPAEGPPVPPLNLIADMGGGGTFLVIGILAGLLERQKSGHGQVLDAAMIDGTVSQLAIILGFRSGGHWGGARGHNLLDGGCAFYRTYNCLDGKWIAVAALEPDFFATLVEGLGLDAAKLLPRQYDKAQWPAMQREFEAVFATKPRGAWASFFEARDACAVPVLDFDEAAGHPHNVVRSTFMEEDGNLVPPPAPRFSRSILSLPGHSVPGAGGEDALKDWGVR